MSYSQPWTRQRIEQLRNAGKIKGSSEGFPVKKFDRRQLLRKKGKQYYWIAKNLFYFAKENGLTLETEYKFHGTRKWRFDFAFLEKKIAVEYEGIFSKKSRHTTFTGYTGDTEKYNAAAVDGWRVIRVTAMNYKTILLQLNSVIKK